MNTVAISLPTLPSVDDDFWQDLLRIDGGEFPFPESPVHPAGDQFLVVLAPSIWRSGHKLRVTAYVAIHSKSKGDYLFDFEADSDWFDFSSDGLIKTAQKAFLESHSRLAQVINEQGWAASWAETDIPTISLQIQEPSDA